MVVLRLRGTVQHCRIKSRMEAGEKKYYLLDVKVASIYPKTEAGTGRLLQTMDTLYELISYYTHHPLVTPKGRTPLRTPCPQPCPHEGQPWFLASASKTRAEVT